MLFFFFFFFLEVSDTQTAYCSSVFFTHTAVIWEALKVAVADLESAKVILEAADVIIAEPDLSVVYDQKGRKYEIPIFCLSEPINLIRE